jgi:hypothetical protein
MYEGSFGTQAEADRPVEENFFEDASPADEEFDFGDDPPFAPEDDLFADDEPDPADRPVDSPQAEPETATDLGAGQIPTDTATTAGPTPTAPATDTQAGGAKPEASGEELGTTAPGTEIKSPDERPTGAGPGSDLPQGPSGGNPNGWGGSGANDTRWTQSTNPGPELNSGYEPKPYPDVFDSSRPGQQNGDWSIVPNPTFIFDESIDPKTGQKQRDSIGAGIEWKVGGPRPRPTSRPPGPRENELPYYNALPPVPEATTMPEGTTSPQGAPSNASPNSRNRPTDPIQPQESPAPATGAGAKFTPASEGGSMKVKVTAADGFTQVVNDVTTVVTGVDPMKTMEGVVQGFVDGTEKVVQKTVGALERASSWLPSQPQPPQQVDPAAQAKERARIEKERQQTEQRKLEQEQKERESRRAESRARIRAAEKEWQATEGTDFGKKHGPRPKDAERAKDWEKKRDRAIRDYLFKKDLHDLQPDHHTDGLRA